MHRPAARSHRGIPASRYTTTLTSAPALTSRRRSPSLKSIVLPPARLCTKAFRKVGDRAKRATQAHPSPRLIYQSYAATKVQVGTAPASQAQATPLKSLSASHTSS